MLKWFFIKCIKRTKENEGSTKLINADVEENQDTNTIAHMFVLVAMLNSNIKNEKT